MRKLDKTLQEPIWSLKEEPLPNQHLGESQTFFSCVALPQRRKRKGLPGLGRCLGPFSRYNKTRQTDAEVWCVRF